MSHHDSHVDLYFHGVVAVIPVVFNFGCGLGEGF